MSFYIHNLFISTSIFIHIGSMSVYEYDYRGLVYSLSNQFNPLPTKFINSLYIYVYSSMSQLGIAFRIKGLESNSKSHSSHSHKKDQPTAPANNVTSWSLSDKIAEDNTLVIPVQPDICLHLKREREIEERALEKEAIRAILRETESHIQEDAITVSTYIQYYSGYVVTV